MGIAEDSLWDYQQHLPPTSPRYSLPMPSQAPHGKALHILGLLFLFSLTDSGVGLWEHEA